MTKAIACMTELAFRSRMCQAERCKYKQVTIKHATMHSIIMECFLFKIREENKEQKKKIFIPVQKGAKQECSVSLHSSVGEKNKNVMYLYTPV